MVNSTFSNNLFETNITRGTYNRIDVQVFDYFGDPTPNTDFALGVFVRRIPPQYIQFLGTGGVSLFFDILPSNSTITTDSQGKCTFW